MSSADLQAAIQDLRNALGDELGGNDDVRDCAFEVVAAYDRASAARATHCARCNSTAPELVADQLPHHCEVTIQAKADFSYALVEGIEAAGEQGIEYPNRDRRLIGEVLDAYGRAKDAGNPGFGRCELSHTFAEVCRFTFQPKQEGFQQSD